MTRLFYGRPYILTVVYLLCLGFIWKRLKDEERPYGVMLFLTAVIALITWIHCAWFILFFPVLSFIFAREWRVARRITVCTVSGILLGAVMTAHPILMLKQNFIHIFTAFFNGGYVRDFVIENKPFTGDMFTVMFVFLLLLWRRVRGSWDIKCVDNPVFILAVLGWGLGFFTCRFWFDLGIPALLVWVTMEFEDIYKKLIPFFSFRRLYIALPVAAVLFIAITNDSNKRWSEQNAAEFLNDNSRQGKEWMPGDGGVVYSDDMRIFYLSFFKYPVAPWKYLVGFNSTLMPLDDRKVFLDINLSGGAGKAFYPWVKKLRPEDRIIITPDKGTPPKVPGIEWGYVGSGFWSGRIKKNIF